jgi:uncharacterized protein YicC (UPF0701 family)
MKTAVEKAYDTIASIRKELDDLPKYNSRELNDIEARMRQELQVMEALVNSLGREVYTRVQGRREELKKENQDWINRVTNPVADRIKENV